MGCPSVGKAIDAVGVAVMVVGAAVARGRPRCATGAQAAPPTGSSATTRTIYHASHAERLRASAAR